MPLVGLAGWEGPPLVVVSPLLVLNLCFLSPLFILLSLLFGSVFFPFPGCAIVT